MCKYYKFEFAVNNYLLASYVFVLSVALKQRTENVEKRRKER